MIRTVIGPVAALAAIFVAGAGTPGPPSSGYAGGPARPAEPRSRLTLSYLADAGFAAAVKLDCDPAGGGHPQPQQACETLEAAGGDPEAIPPTLSYCVLVHAPVMAEMTGTWRGGGITWRHRYGNTCEMRRATGALFAF